MSGIAAAIGAGVAVLGTGFQISQGLKQGKLAKDAQRASAAALAQAKQRLDVNRLEGIQVPLESYERMMKEMTAQQKQSLTSLQESDERTLAAGVGKLYAAASGETEKAREKMGEAIYDRDKMIAKEDARIDRALASISLEEAIGFEKEAAQREEAAALNFAGAISGLGQAASLYQQSRPLFSARQGQLGAAQAYQQQTGKYGDMNARQARRAMIKDGIGEQGFQNLAAGLTVGGRAVQTAIAPPMAGIQPLTGATIPPVQFTIPPITQ